MSAFIGAINEKGELRAFMRLDDRPRVLDVIDTLTDWAETDPSRRLVIASSVDEDFSARSNRGEEDNG